MFLESIGYKTKIPLSFIRIMLMREDPPTKEMMQAIVSILLSNQNLVVNFIAKVTMSFAC